MKIISIKDFDNIRIGNAQNTSAGTGCTVIISENGMCAGLDVRGGGPASRESETVKPLALPIGFTQSCSAVEVLSDLMLPAVLCSFWKRKESGSMSASRKFLSYDSQIFLI